MVLSVPFQVILVLTRMKLGRMEFNITEMNDLWVKQRF